MCALYDRVSSPVSVGKTISDDGRPSTNTPRLLCKNVVVIDVSAKTIFAFRPRVRLKPLTTWSNCIRARLYVVLLFIAAVRALAPPSVFSKLYS